MRAIARQGQLILEEGVLVDARTSDRVGESAALDIVRWSGVEISLELPPPRFQRTVEMSLPHLLLESARRSDEQAVPTRFPGENSSIEYRQSVASVESLAEAPLSKERLRKIGKAIESLEQIRRFSAAAVVDLRDGESIHSVGSVGTVAAAEAALQWFPVFQQEILQISDSSGEFQTLIVNTNKVSHFLRLIPRVGLLYVVVERDGANLAIAWRQVESVVSEMHPRLTER